MKNKVLVCITIQENSRRLITEGFNLAESLNASLHILHIRKGRTIFDNSESSKLLEKLFTYGSELGGEVHFLCSENIPQTISSFISTNQITEVIIGQAPEEDLASMQPTIYNKLTNNLSHVHVTVIPRDTVEKLDA